MRRGTWGGRRSVTDLELELEELKRRHAALRQQLRRVKRGAAGVGKLQEKLEKQLAAAKWTVQQIHQIDPSWDDKGFYESVAPREPKPRGRRPTSTEGAGSTVS
jgi:uncharacterized protein (DUF3084 family)